MTFLVWKWVNVANWCSNVEAKCTASVMIYRSKVRTGMCKVKISLLCSTQWQCITVEEIHFFPDSHPITVMATGQLQKKFVIIFVFCSHKRWTFLGKWNQCYFDTKKKLKLKHNSVSDTSYKDKQNHKHLLPLVCNDWTNITFKQRKMLRCWTSRNIWSFTSWRSEAQLLSGVPVENADHKYFLNIITNSATLWTI